MGAVGDVRVGGDLTGGSGSGSGQISGLGPVGDVTIGGDVIGGANGGGVISSNGLFDGVLGNVRIGGNLIGGGVFASNAMGDVRIGGDVIGGSIAGSISASDTGGISCLTGRIASVTIGGSLFAGSNTGTDSLERSGFIFAGDDLGPVKIRGSIIGLSGNPALIIAKGQDVKPGTGFDTAIASLTVGGDVRFGFVAQQIGSFKASGFTAPLLAATANQNIAIPFTNDVRIHEV